MSKLHSFGLISSWAEKRRPAGQIDGWTLSRLCQRFGQRREMPSCQNENVYLRKQKNREKLKKYFLFLMPLCLMELYRVVPNFWPIWVHLQQIWFDQKDFQRRMKLQRWEEAGFLHFYGDTEVGLHKCKETCLRFRICMGIDVYLGVHSRTLSRGSRTMLQTLHLAAMLQLKVDNYWGSMDVSSLP